MVVCRNAGPLYVQFKSHWALHTLPSSLIQGANRLDWLNIGRRLCKVQQFTCWTLQSHIKRLSQSEHQMSKTPVSHFCILFFSKAHSWISDAFLMSLDTCKCQCQHTQRASEDRHFLSFGALWLLHGMSQRLDDSTNAPRLSHATILKRNAIAARHEGGGRLGGHLVLLAKKAKETV